MGTHKREAAFSIVSAIVVLLTSLVDPTASIVIAMAALGLMGTYQYTKK